MTVELYLTILAIVGIIFWCLSIWLNLETWRIYEQNCIKIEEQRTFLTRVQRSKMFTKKATLIEASRKPPAVLSPTRQKEMAKVIKFNSAKQLQKLLNNKGKGDK